MCLPVLALISLGAIDLNAVHASRSRLQDIADAAALAGATELGVAIDDTAAIERAEGFLRAQLADWTGAPKTDISLKVVKLEQQRLLHVRLDASRPSFFGNILPPGGWKFRAESSATALGLTPLCVLVTDDRGKNVLQVKDRGRISAPGCMVHSNRDIVVTGGSIYAGQIQAVTEARGVMMPAPGTSAPPIRDPFADISLGQMKDCPKGEADNLPTSGPKHQLQTGVIHLPAGLHCGGYRIGGDAELRLGAGDHWFLKGHLDIRDNARLTGEDVVLIFDNKSKFDFTGSSTVALDGRKTGTFAGMVLVGAGGNKQDFVISSDHVESLLGVIYVPEARIIVEGKSDVARDSAWTVIVAAALELKGSPSLFINANYTGTTVPVPDGVGPRKGGSRLID